MAKDSPISTEIMVRVIPGASKNEVAEEVNGIWKIRLAAPPTEGRANRALVEFLAGELRVNRSQVTLRRGETSRHKTIAVYGLCAAEIAQRLKENK